MAVPQIYEGTAEEIAVQLRRSNLAGRLRAIVLPELDSEIQESKEVGETLAERLQGRLGRFDFGNANLSEDTGKKFADLLAAEHQTGQS